jgi:adenine phosphoribosyltransferase
LKSLSWQGLGFGLNKKIVINFKPSMNLKDFIAEVSDFPKPGILYRDMSPLLSHGEAFEKTLDAFADILPIHEAEIIVGVEMRGVIFASALAARFKKGFLALRKAGKTPPPVLKKSYKLEYGSAEIEVKAGQGKVILLDDVLATGGTLKASIELLNEAGYDLRGVAVLINLTQLNTLQWKGKPINSIMQF